MAQGSTRCVEGRVYRHDPQYDDPDLETDIGQCPECEGDGCDEEDGEDDDGCCPGCGACPGFTGVDCDETCEWATTGGGKP